MKKAGIRMPEVARQLTEFATVEPGIGLQVSSYESDELQRSFDSLQHLTQFARALGFFDQVYFIGSRGAL